MVRIKRPTRSISSQRVSKDNDPSICLTAVKTEVEQHGIEIAHAPSICMTAVKSEVEQHAVDNAHASSICLTAVESEVEQHGNENTDASSHGLNRDLEERCSEHCLTTSAGYLVVESDNNKNIATDQLSKPCAVDTKIIASNPDSTTFDNVSTDVKLESCGTSECGRKGSLYAVEPLNTYYRRKGFFRSVKSFKTYRRRRSGYVSLGINSSPIQNSMEIKVEISAANATPEQSMELDPSEKSDIIDETCDMLPEGNNIIDASCGITSYTELVERKQDDVEEASLVPSKTMEPQIISQPGGADGKLLTEEASFGSIKRKLLVLDINGLLADIVPAARVSHEYKSDPDTIIAGKAVFKRPFCDEFLEFCFERFNVGVWSSRTKKNVDSVLNFLMGEKRQNLLFCWDQSHCTWTRYNTPDNDAKPLLFKKLNKLWENSETGLPWKTGDYDDSDTLLLDDSPYKALLNPPNTAIFPRTYQYGDEKDSSLGPNGDLRIYLEGLSKAPNVQEYVKHNPYGQDPITEKHASWPFYHEVIESTVVGSLRKPYQSSVSSEKLRKDVSQANKTTVVAETSKEFLGSNGTFQQLEKSISTGSPCSTQRGFKRGRSQSPPRHDIGKSQSHSLSPKKCRRSKSPAPSHGSEFRSDKATIYRPECRNFSQGRCLRGTACRFEHHQSRHQSYADRGVHQNEGQIFKPQYGPRECREFVQGKCSWGASCRFSHSVPDKTDLRTEVNERHGKQCDDIRRDKAGPRECRDFVQGKCSWGESCRFLHSVPEKTDVGMEGAETQGTETHDKRCDVIKRDKAVPQGCYDFIQGKCNWGESCRFQHSLPGKIDLGTEGKEIHDKKCDNFRSDKALPRECRDFIQGKCTWGASCRFLHSVPDKNDIGTEGHETHGKQYFSIRRENVVQRECNDFIRGKCNFGTSCRYLHSVPEKTNSSFHNRYYQDVTSSSKISDDCGKGQTSSPTEHGNDKEVPEVCKNYSQGRHLDQELDLTAGLRSTSSQPGDTSNFKAVREVCRKYTWGRCYNGSNCRYLHQESNLAVHEVCKNYTWGRCYNGSNCRYLHQESNLAVHEVCKNYTWGRCHNGSNCRRLHQESSPTVREVCKNYTWGRCHNGSNCRRLHQESNLARSESTSQVLDMSRYRAMPDVCRNYSQGRCYKGLDRQLLHPEPLIIVGFCSTSQVGETSRFNPVSEVCRNYTQGRCHKGSGSTGQFGQASRFIKQPEVCKNYTFGKCHKGSDCQYSHLEPGACRSPWQNKYLPHQTTSSGMRWNTKSLASQRVASPESDQCGSSRSYRSHQQDGDVPMNSKNFCSFSDTGSVPHETSVHEHTESRTEEMIPEKRDTVEALPNQHIDSESFQEACVVRDDDAEDIKHLESHVRVSIDNLGNSDQMILDADNSCHETSVHEDTEPQTKELIRNFHVSEEKRGTTDALHNSFRKDSVVPDDDTKVEKVPECSSR